LLRPTCLFRVRDFAVGIFCAILVALSVRLDGMFFNVFYRHT